MNPIPSSSTSMMARPAWRELRMVIEPGPTFRDSPCLIEFSTSGCRIMLGTRMPNVSGPMSFFTRRFGPKRITSMSRYSSIDSSSAQRHKLLVTAQQATEQRRELDDQRAGGVGLRADQRGDRRQRVEQEVRVNLTLERLDLRRQEQLLLLLQPMLDAGAVPDLDRGGHADRRREHDHRHHPRRW